jgi:hypothetical protein
MPKGRAIDTRPPLEGETPRTAGDAPPGMKNLRIALRLGFHFYFHSRAGVRGPTSTEGACRTPHPNPLPQGERELSLLPLRPMRLPRGPVAGTAPGVGT